MKRPPARATRTVSVGKRDGIEALAVDGTRRWKSWSVWLHSYQEQSGWKRRDHAWYRTDWVWHAGYFHTQAKAERAARRALDLAAPVSPVTNQPKD